MAQAVTIYRVQAAEELEKNPDLKKEDLTVLREWLSTEKHLPAITDEMLILFHHSCYFDIERTKECIENYYTIRTHTPELFTNRDVTNQQLTRAVQALDTMILPTTDRNGYHIIYQGLRNFDPSNYMQMEGLKLMYMTMDAYFQCHGTTPGFVMLHSMQGANLSHLFKTNITMLKKSFQYMQEANPIRLKAIHILNVVPWVNKALSVIKPIVKKEVLELVHFYQEQDVELLYDHIPKESLPKEFGGSLKSLKELNVENTKMLSSLAGFFAAEEKLRVDESRRGEKKKRRTDKSTETK